jgi:hypothetical protein
MLAFSFQLGLTIPRSKRSACSPAKSAMLGTTWPTPTKSDRQDFGVYVREHVVADARSVFADHGMLDRQQTMGCSFFERVPAGAILTS